MFSSRVSTFLGTVMAATAVLVGAFGAHWLTRELPKWYHDAAEVTRMADRWNTGAHYHLIHAVALTMLGVWCKRRTTILTQVVGLAFFLGIVLFSGSLYLLVLTGKHGWGGVVPVGGVAFVVGWLLWSWDALSRPAALSADVD